MAGEARSAQPVIRVIPSFAVLRHAVRQRISRVEGATSGGVFSAPLPLATRAFHSRRRIARACRAKPEIWRIRPGAATLTRGEATNGGRRNGQTYIPVGAHW